MIRKIQSSRIHSLHWKDSMMSLRAIILMIMTLSISGCESSITVEQTGGKKQSASLTSLKPIAAKPGDIVTLTGSGFNSTVKNQVRITKANGDSVTAPVAVTNEQSANFIMPDGAGLGLTSLTLEAYGKQKSTPLSFVADLDTNGLPILIIDQSEICSSVQYIDKNGDTQTGTRNCAGTSADLSNLTAANIKSGVVINGVTGTMTPSPGNCSSDGATGCVTTASFKSANMTNATVSNIKSGVTIAGVTGQYPSATYTLDSATETTTDDLDSATFYAKVKSAAGFEYWNAAGVRQTGNGDADIDAANIKDQVSIFSTVGTYTGSGGSVNAWDLRAGVTVGAVTGKLKVNCRNRVNLATQDMDAGRVVSGISGNVLTSTGHGLVNNDKVRLLYSTAPTGGDYVTTYYVIYIDANTFSLSTTSGPGAAMTISGGANLTVHKWQDGNADIWDTIDDSGATTIVTDWANNDCYGIESTAGDSNVWKDVTTSNGVTASNCTTQASNCTMQDKITNLWWSARQVSQSWNNAISLCGTTLNTTTYSGNSSVGYNGQTGWRLPTQKELIAASDHGIRSAASPNWISSSYVTGTYWSSTTHSPNTGFAYVVGLGSGSYNVNYKYDIVYVVCVRP